MNALRHWFDYLIEEKAFKGTNPARDLSRKAREEHPKSYLTVAEVKWLIEAAYRHSYNTERHRNAALITFMYGTGLKVAEVCNLRIGDVPYQEGLPYGSTFHNMSSLVLSAPAKRALRMWLSRLKEADLYPEDPSGHIWITITKKGSARRGRPLDPQGVRAILERYGKLADMPVKVTPSLLRDTFTQELARAKAKEEVIRALQGHKESQVSEQEMAEAMALLPDFEEEPTHEEELSHEEAPVGGAELEALLELRAELAILRNTVRVLYEGLAKDDGDNRNRHIDWQALGLPDPAS